MAYSDKEKEDIVTKICKRVSRGEALRTVLKDSDMPSSKTFFEWVDADELKVKQYVRACSNRADAIFEDILDIADESSNDTITVDGVERTNHEVISRSKLRVDARKWMLGKLNPSKYSDKTTIEGGDKPVETISKVINLGSGKEPKKD